MWCEYPSLRDEWRVFRSRQGVVMNQNKLGLLLIFIVCALFLAACQANYIRDVTGGTVAPSVTSTLTGMSTQ